MGVIFMVQQFTTNIITVGGCLIACVVGCVMPLLNHVVLIGYHKIKQGLNCNECYGIGKGI